MDATTIIATLVLLAVVVVIAGTLVTLLRERAGTRPGSDTRRRTDGGTDRGSDGSPAAYSGGARDHRADHDPSDGTSGSADSGGADGGGGGGGD